MLFLTLYSSVFNIARLNNCVWMGNDAQCSGDRRESEPAYLPELERIESYNRELVDNCTLKIYCERSLQQLNMREKPQSSHA